MYQNSISILAESLTKEYKDFFRHSGLNGSNRENALKDFLRKVNSKRYGFESGEVFDKKNSLSHEVDIVIYDEIFSTVFHNWDTVKVPVESTYGIIEVKTTLTIHELEDSIKKLISYNNLSREEAEPGQNYILPNISLGSGQNITISKSDNMRINGIFAYNNKISHKTIMKMLYEAKVIDYIVVPNRYIIIGRQRSNFNVHFDGSTYDQYCIHSSDSVGLWITYLQIMLSKSQLIGSDLTSQFKGLITSENCKIDVLDTKKVNP